MIESQVLAPPLRMKNISKSFGATCALDSVNFELQKGEVHALLGENGAGKSTLVKILSGAIKPDSGSMFLEDSPYAPSDPLDGKKSGISMIYQELNLAPHLTVEENILLGNEIHSLGFVRRREMSRKVKRALEVVNHPEISLDTPVRRLSVGAKQVAEIARALVDEAKILVMDEPTSSLSLEDIHRLFQIIKSLKAQGVSIIYISHFLEEVREVADAYTVLRDGKKIGSGKIENISLEELIQMMVGQKLVEMFPRVERKIGEVLLSLNHLKGKKMQAEVDLNLHRGEILGVAGLIGAGRTEMLRTAFGLDSIERGSLKIASVSFAKVYPWKMIDQGVGFLSEDRQGEGLALARTIADNMTLSDFSPYCRFGFLQIKKQNRAVSDFIQRMKIKARSSIQPVLSLSGGNQQKVAIARLLHQKADILLLDEPTRGIDVVSKSQIYEWIGELAREGKAVLFVSSYIPELLGVCDNIAVFHRGHLVEMRPASEWDAQSIMTVATVGSAIENA
jgi:ribose transport system ATP-binding protein